MPHFLSLPIRYTRPQFRLLCGLGLLLTLASWSVVLADQPAPDPTVCYAIADNQGKLPGGSTANDQDELVQMNRQTAATTPLGATGTTNIEAMTFVPQGDTNTLYAADGGQLGQVDLTTGLFTALPQPAGSGTGAEGPVKFTELDSLAYDLTTHTLFAAHRRGASQDLLLQLDPATGAHIPNAFGPSQDYLVVPAPASQPSFQDVDELAFDPTTGALYATVNDGGSGGLLVQVNKVTAALSAVGVYTDTATPGNFVDDIEAISFFADGTLYASTGNNGPDSQDKNKLWQIDKQTGAATLIGAFPVTFVDYEALGCLTANPAATSTPTATSTATPLPPTLVPLSPTSTATPTETVTVPPTVTVTPPLATGTPPSTLPATPTPTRTVEPPTSLEPGDEPSANQRTLLYLPSITK